MFKISDLSEMLIVLCAVVSLYFSVDIVKISWHREMRREEIVQEMQCKHYGQWINHWAVQQNLEPPCK